MWIRNNEQFHSDPAAICYIQWVILHCVQLMLLYNVAMSVHGRLYNVPGDNLHGSQIGIV